MEKTTMQSAKAKDGNPAQAATRHGDKWIWSRIMGLRQQLRKAGSSEEILAKLAVLGEVIIQRSKQVANHQSKARETFLQIKTKEAELSFLKDELANAKVEVNSWKSISIYGQNTHCKSPEPNHSAPEWKLHNPLKYAKKLEAAKQPVAEPKESAATGTVGSNRAEKDGSTWI